MSFLSGKILNIWYLIIGFFGITNKISIVPANDLVERGDGAWRSLGEDPYFILKGNMMSGWNKLYWNSKSDKYIPLKIYWDNGEGFSEERSATFSGIPSGNVNYKTFLFIPPKVQGIRLDPGEGKSEFEFRDLKIRRISRVSVVVSAFRNFLKQRGIGYKKPGMIFSKIVSIYRNEGIASLWLRVKRNLDINSNNVVSGYESWIEKNKLMDFEIERIKDKIEQFTYKPLISVILPVYNVDEVWLRKCIDSVIKQYYSNWELCISDDASTKKHIRKVLQEYEEQDSRIKVVFRTENGHISNSSNSALQLAKGEFIALLDHDDELTADALYENVSLLNINPDADVIYSDEDKISTDGERFSPYFKPDWSPDLLMSQMYICHLTLYRKILVDKLGGFRTGYEGSQDYDLMLRVSELTDEIYHIPKILYHWRTIPNSTASNTGSKNYTHIAGLKALESAVERRGIEAVIESIEDESNIYLTRYMPVGNPKVSIIIPTKNMVTVLQTCLESIFEKTNYENFEVLIIDNGSDDSEVIEAYRYWETKEKSRFKVWPLDIPFNYSKLNNYGVTKAKGELLLLLNNDVEVISENWLTDMVGQAVRPEVGAVGASLYYPDNLLQHGGVVLGLGGVAGHSHKHFPAENPGYFRRLKVISNYTAVTAACLMIRKEIFLEVGGLEEELQVAFNDVDFCLKVWSKGYNNVWLPHVKLYHYESKSRGYEDTPEKQERFLKEINWIKRHWSNILENDPAYNPNLTKDREDFSLGEPQSIYNNNIGVNRRKISKQMQIKGEYSG
ncbi:glycosyltransferase family 2 protein [Paenibacillus sp. FSL H7-0714]|uniref:glycosyltransferase family 2 protein n=1 Tax=Paenibacillus sp. FSL H7-0714 TaxID=2954735 RepID=UPI0030F907D7